MSTNSPSLRPALARIEGELRDLWRDDAAPGEVQRTRVCTANLVVVASNRAVADAYTAVIDEVVLAVPARAVVVLLDPATEPATLEGGATAVCSVDGVCSERISLRATGSACARVASAVDALLVPEIPTTLVWLGRVHVGDPVFRELALDAARIVLDTDYTSLASLLSLTRWVREDRARGPVADLAWTRLSTWQELAARFFDDPANRSLAASVDAITLTQASAPGSALGSETALFLGWLSSSLGLEIERLGGSIRLRRKDGGKVALRFVSTPRPEGVAPATLAGVKIEASHDGATLVGSIVRELASGRPDDPTPDADVLEWSLARSGHPRMEQRVRLGSNKGARQLQRTLQRPAHDPLLEIAALFAEQLDEDGVVSE